MAKDIGSYFLEQGQPIVPKAKPKQYTIAKEKSQTAEVLDMLNTKAAVNTLSPRTYVNLVGQIARKAYDQQDISASDYYDIVMPLFGEKGEMITEKIRQYDAELDRYADGGRIGYKDGSKFKIQASGSKTGKQQIQGAPEGITSDKEIINAILTMDIPLTEKVNLIGDVQYGKFRDKIEYKDNEIFLDDPKSYRDRNIGLDYNRDGEGFSGSATVGDRGPAFNIKFKKSFEDGGRVNFGKGAGGSDPKTGMGFQKGNTGFRTKDGEVRNVKGSNQFTPKTTAQIQGIINDPKYKGYTPTRFEKEKILTRTDTKNKDVVFQKKGITPADPEKQKTQKAITSKKRLERLKKISNPNIEKKIAGKGGLNLSHIGQYNTPVTLSNLAYLPADVNIKSYENFEKKIQNNFNKILTVYRNEKLKPEVKTEKIAALMKEDRQLRSDNPKYANIKSRMSIRRTALDPSGIMIKEKIRDPKMTIGKGEAGLNLKQAKPRSSERKGILTIAKNALQSLKAKGAPGLGSGEFKDPLGGQIDLIDVQKLIKRPDNV